MKKKRPSRKLTSLKETVNKFKLYEEAVQSPDWHAKHLPEFHEWLTNKKPYLLREDFCGTSRISCEWAKKSKKHQAVGLDLDQETLDYALNVNIAALPKDAQKRVTLYRQNVLVPTTKKFDLIAACNFSFFIFKEREALLQYAHAAFKSLKKGGTFFLEMAGGEGMLEEVREPRSFTLKGYGKVKYVWEQHQYDPITAVSDYSIHFRLPNGRWMKDAFTYHWRLWGIRETREILKQAGFKRTEVFWETCNRKGEGTGNYVPMENGDHAHAWIAYVIGVK